MKISLLYIFALLLFLQPFLTKATASSKPEPTLKGKKVLFVYGGYKPHEPQECMEYFVPWLESEGATVMVSDDLEIYTDSDLMDGIDLILQVWTLEKISGPQIEGLSRAIKKGAGFAGWHGGIGDSFRDNTKFQFIAGGQFVAHPGGIVDYKVKIVDKKDPVTKGIKDFAMKSEQYYMHVDPNVKVLATTSFTGDHEAWIEDCVIPVMWKKQYGKGRVFYSSLGHKLEHLKTPNALETIKRGIRWAGESKYHAPEKWRKSVYR